VRTFFVRLFGIDHFTVTRDSKAVYVTPVPMGSPLAYYGVYQLCSVTDTCIIQTSPAGVTVASQGFFGAIEGQGSNRSTGDAFATGYNPKPTVNSQYVADGYRYIVQAGSTNGTVYLYDPAFCATSTKPSGGHAGAGDHWLGTPVPVSTYYILWDTHNTPLAPAIWTKSALLYETNDNQVDKSTTYGAGGTYSDSGTPSSPGDCTNDRDHNNWVALGAATAGETYSLQVTTTNPDNPTGNLNQTFENMFSIAVSGGGQVYGSGSMVTYANVTSGSQEFYLAQIDRTAGAGKTVEIDLFDPGDTGGPSWLQIEPDGSPAWQPTTFSYTADNGLFNSNTNCIQTHVGGSPAASPPSLCNETATGSSVSLYDNHWVKILVTLPTTYGDSAHPLTQNGWWKIKYTVAGANDTTTWQVSILGNPVHLI
jgi:hypothetical protein